MVRRKTLTPEQVHQVEELIRIINTPEKIQELRDIMDDHDTLREVAEKEKTWTRFKKSARDLATLFLAVSAAMYGLYEIWIRFVMNSIKIGGGQ